MHGTNNLHLVQDLDTDCKTVGPIAIITGDSPDRWLDQGNRLAKASAHQTLNWVANIINANGRGRVESTYICLTSSRPVAPSSDTSSCKISLSEKLNEAHVVISSVSLSPSFGLVILERVACLVSINKSSTLFQCDCFSQLTCFSQITYLTTDWFMEPVGLHFEAKNKWLMRFQMAGKGWHSFLQINRKQAYLSYLWRGSVVCRVRRVFIHRWMEAKPWSHPPPTCTLASVDCRSPELWSSYSSSMFRPWLMMAIHTRQSSCGSNSIL